MKEKSEFFDPAINNIDYLMFRVFLIRQKTDKAKILLEKLDELANKDSCDYNVFKRDLLYNSMLQSFDESF